MDKEKREGIGITKSSGTFSEQEGMASMDYVDDVDFSPHQATPKESMNSKNDVKYICDGCRRRVESSMEDYKCKKVEEGHGEKRKVGEGVKDY
uniref:Uncharacterized protein n=1 Tax=Oryza nivara TaxID=4536 RepID=A0A0E0HY12_ORYNI